VKRLLAAGLLALGAAASASALAQTNAQVQAEVDADTVAVGDVLHLQMTATSSDSLPSDPRPGPTPGFAVRGQSASPSQTLISINGSRMDRYTLTVDWTLLAQRAGQFTLGPVSAAMGGARVTSRPIVVHVVPAGQAPPRRGRPAFPQMPFGSFGLTPFDPWKGLFPGFEGNDQEQRPPDVTTDPRLALDSPRGPYDFLHATIDKTAAVVGEQVTFSIYEYQDVEAPGEIDQQDFHDAQVADFVKQPLVPEDQQQPLKYASVGGRTWAVRLIRKWALFPLRTGDLLIGPMSVKLGRPRPAAGVARETETFHVRVTEPPAGGRPPGYALGDVGRFALSAQVDPREVDQGGAVGVHVELSGTGNLPARLAPAARAGVEWLAPEVHEQVGPTGRDTFGGKRTFDYVVRMQRAGSFDLGEIAVPFWDPAAKAYDVARAALGVVHVKAAAMAGGGGADRDELLGGLPGPRDVEEARLRATRPHWDDAPAFWWLGIGACPVAFGVAVAGRATGRGIARRWRARRASPATDLKERVAAAQAASRGKDGRTTDAATARALEAATVAYAGVSVRDAIGREVVDRLEKAGVRVDDASRVADLLHECDLARFAPEASDVASARARWERARAAIRGLEKRP